MKRFSRLSVFQIMGETAIIPLFYHQDIEINKKVIKACYDGGARVFEFTNRGIQTHHLFSELKRWASEEMDDLILGVGSIVDAGTAALFIQEGADFVVSPIVNVEMAKVCNRRKIAWIPGCATLSEINFAEELGAEIVKLFPAAQIGGPDFIKSVLGPNHWSSLMPSGGVLPEQENLEKWFQAGAYCVGLGSKLIIKNKNGEYDYEKIRTLTKDTINFARDIKSQVE